MTPRAEFVLSAPSREQARLPATTFLWRRPPAQSSFVTDLGPWAEGLGRLPHQYIDFLRIAVAIYVMDRTTPRSRGRGNRWQRRLEVSVPLLQPDLWSAQSSTLEDTMGFLTGDAWTFTFTHRRAAERRATGRRRVKSVPVVCLFSGGADSFSGALQAYSQTGTAPYLISHWDWSIVRAAQLRAYEAFRDLTGETADSEAIHVGRRSAQIGSGISFPTEDTSRSRSVLFIAIGVAAAYLRDAELWMPENGFVSLNVPLAPERRSSLSTRTTHPRFLLNLQGLLRSADITVPIRNPFVNSTKGEVFRTAAAQFDPQAVGRALSSTHSCARSDARWAGFPPGSQCGVCYACLVRRAAFVAAGLRDETGYIEEAVRAEGKLDSWLTNTRRADYETVRYAVARGFEMPDILSLRLPIGSDLPSALALARRGLQELARLNIG